MHTLAVTLDWQTFQAPSSRVMLGPPDSMTPLLLYIRPLASFFLLTTLAPRGCLHGCMIGPLVFSFFFQFWYH